MPTLRKRSRTLETSASSNHNNNINNGEVITQSEKTVSGYEESREKRIRENIERMQKLGIMDLSLKLKSCSPSNKQNYSVKKTPNRNSPLQHPEPTRRSYRYGENLLEAKQGSELFTANVIDEHVGLSKLQSNDMRDYAINGEKEDELYKLHNSDIKIEMESRSREQKPTSSLEPSLDSNGGILRQKIVSGYEESREKRIKENLERMQKLGIMDLSLKLKSCSPSNKRNYSVKNAPNRNLPLQPLSPTRRSSRLQNVTPVSYVEVHKAKKEGSLQVEDILQEEGLRPEIYTETHEKLLGDCKMSWRLYVDGYGEDGKRVYDSFKGKSCHQCRQKTLGLRTHCSQCNMIQGQFCRACLYTRYGENLFEAKQNPNWICPVCRGICNCSLCRKAKGLTPTGYLYKKVTNLGYKSVAHYLKETQRHSMENSGSTPGTKTTLSTKRSLPFLDMEAPPAKVNDDHHLGVSKPQAEDKKDTEFKVEENTEMHFLDDGDCNIAPGNSQKNKELKEEILAVNHAGNYISAGTSVSEKGSEFFTDKVNDDYLGTSNPQSKGGREEDGLYILCNSDINCELESRSRKQKTLSAIEPCPDSIGGRLRQRRKLEKSHEHEEDVDAINGEEDNGPLTLYNSDIKIDLESHSRKQKRTSLLEPSPDGIGGRLRQRRKGRS